MFSHFNFLAILVIFEFLDSLCYVGCEHCDTEQVLEAIKAKKQHIPYRDSKLTFLLKDSIGNNAKTLMFVNVSSCSKDVNQTMISLLFADRVRNVELGRSKQMRSNISPEKVRRQRRSSVSSVSSM